MSTHAAETSIGASVVVAAPIERAFSVFTKDFGRFKPREHNLLQAEIAETVFEPRAPLSGVLFGRRQSTVGASSSSTRCATANAALAAGTPQ